MLAGVLAELTETRLDRGLSVVDVGRAIGLSGPAVSRLLAGRTDDAGVIRLSKVASVVGLDLSVRLFPGGSPLRDAGHAALLREFRSHLHSSLVWGTEVPLPSPRDQRAWDAFVRGRGWRYGVEAETHPTDAQALGRRLELKRRDGDVDGVILVVPATRHVRGFLAIAGDVLAPSFPVPGRRPMELLGAGVDPGGSSIVVL
jgi:transcriptional regulator with XRE-family HTH domain